MRDQKKRDFRGIQVGAVICVLGSLREIIGKVVNIIHVMKRANSSSYTVFTVVIWTEPMMDLIV